MKQFLLPFTLALTAPLVAFGWGAAIASPQLGFPDDAPPATVQKVMATLIGDFAFVDGFFVDEFSTEHFTGSADKLCGLIASLHESRFQLKLRFADLHSEKTTFALFQNSRQRQEIIITINTANKATDLSALKIDVP
jgi:hypothetical protein